MVEKISDIIPLPLLIVGSAILILVVLIIILSYIPVRERYTYIPQRMREGYTYIPQNRTPRRI